jgi:protein arginine N-methyltransferase 1
MKQYEVKKPEALQVIDWDIEFHNIMLNDSERMKAFKKAIFEVVKEGDVVLDLGVGTGILAQWALEAGAAKVYGVDFNKTILDYAQQNPNLKKFGDNYIPIFGNSMNVELPEKVDVIISETIGNFADNENCVEYLKDARKRFLKQDGIMIPSQLKQFLVPVCSPEVEKNIESAHLALPYFETVIPKRDYVAQPQLVNTFSFIESDQVDYTKNLSFECLTSKKITGFKGWYRAQLSPLVILDSEITFEDSSWNNFYFSKQVELGEGETTLDIKITRNNNMYSFEQVTK